MITQSELKRRLQYDPMTGDLVWLVKPKRGRVKAGDVAGAKVLNYLRVKIDGKLYAAHRLIWLYVTGEWPESFLDHINGIPLDNRWSNLRAATNSQNQANRKRRRTSLSPYKGITRTTDGKRWAAKIRHMGKTIHLGSFDIPEEAHAAYMAAAARIFGEFARAA